ncbi:MULTISPECIES: UDP-N-acetylglucosamine 2-epimerase [Prochlorococcus]|uniref:UDP-N-acetylglucosamine 2-epimerase n=1 Tax=Prochlorococcus TaxID=1218 RepID=UPI0007B382CD|nr:UDP-N-acetylglucosamine 2-epimerase [Prochlorococcus marinus]
MAKKLKKLCIITGSRAEYGLLKEIIRMANDDKDIELCLVVTASHLSNELGYTVDEIRQDGIPISYEIEMLIGSDTPRAITKSSATLMIGLADLLEKERPECVLLLGDRYEIHAACTSTMLANIPIAHIHGGELTQGLIDDSIRHSITKMSHIHFVVAETYRRRIIQMGEDPKYIYNVGGLGVDAIKNTSIKDKRTLEREIGFDFGEKSLIVTHHPTTLKTASDNKEEIESIIKALELHSDINLLFTGVNADTYSRVIFDTVKKFCSRRRNAIIVNSLGKDRYFSCLAYADGVLGNSSSGIMEVPYFKKSTINIGDRQAGRIRMPSIIDCGTGVKEISEAIDRLFSPDQQILVSQMHSFPYGYGGASNQIIEILKNLDTRDLTTKKFNDIMSK